MPIFPFLRWIRRPKAKEIARVQAIREAKLAAEHPVKTAAIPAAETNVFVRRHFYNEPAFQCFASFFPLWDGWVTAGHVLTDTAHNWPDFTGRGEDFIWPGGLDAALKGCNMPRQRPASPKDGQAVELMGYPAGSRHLERRTGTVYIERGAGSGTWIAHIKSPDEPVVVGMSGGPVIDQKTGTPIGIVITRNSPADLNADRDPDESCDFVALSAIWDAVEKERRMS